MEIHVIISRHPRRLAVIGISVLVRFRVFYNLVCATLISLSTSIFIEILFTLEMALFRLLALHVNLFLALSPNLRIGRPN